MLQMGHSILGPGPPGLASSTPLKRPRPQPDEIIGTTMQKQRIVANSKNIVVRTVPETVAAPVRSQSTVDQISKMVEIRFKKALRRNDSTMLQRCLESGYTPSTDQWLNIIGKMHVATALKCVALARTLKSQCISAAIRRQHKKLFKEVITRVEKVPVAHMQNLMVAPAYYLEVCLNKGLDPNIPLKNKRLPLEHACAHSRIAHIEILLKDTRTRVSQNVCRFMIRQAKQQKFAERAIELCNDIVPNMILEAIVANVTTALTSIMAKLETKYEDNNQWNEIEHMLRCPISQDYTADLVKTPVNDHYYDRAQLLKWVRAKGTDPLTREPLIESDLLLRSEFLKEYAGILQAKIKKLDV